MAPQDLGPKMDSLLLSQKGVKALDRSPTTHGPRISPFWAAVGAVILLALAAGIVLLLFG